MIRIVAFAIAALVVVGCATSAPPSPPLPQVSAEPAPTFAPDGGPAPQPSAMASAEPSPTLLTVEQAAAAYKALARTYNRSIDAAWKKYGKRATFKAQKKYYALMAKANAKFTTGLKAIAFPADIQPDADRLIRADVVFRRAALSVTKAKTVAQLNSRIVSADKRAEKAVDLAAILRDELGLPPNT